MQQVLMPIKFNRIEIPDQFHPQVVDRFIQHCYMGAYHLDHKGRAVVIHHAKRYPDGINKDSFIYPRSANDFHLDMYGLAEFCDAPFLKKTVYQKLTECLLTSPRYLTAHKLAALVQRVCQD